MYEIGGKPSYNKQLVKNYKAERFVITAVDSDGLEKYVLSLKGHIQRYTQYTNMLNKARQFKNINQVRRYLIRHDGELKEPNVYSTYHTISIADHYNLNYKDTDVIVQLFRDKSNYFVNAYGLTVLSIPYEVSDRGFKIKSNIVISVDEYEDPQITEHKIQIELFNLCKPYNNYNDVILR